MREEFIEITFDLQKVVSESGVRAGICFVNSMHTTAGVTINEGADISVRNDILATLSKLVPKSGTYTHMEGNSDSHIKTSMMGASLCVPIEDGKLLLGTWQAVYFCEFDGPRRRTVAVKIIADKS